MASDPLTQPRHGVTDIFVMPSFQRLDLIPIAPTN
jgi:hypothetical protein